MPIFGILVEMGLVPEMRVDVDDAVAVLGDVAERCHRKHPAGSNPAKDLAAKISGKVPVVYGGHGVGSTAAYRFKCDLNEYAKTPAFWNVLPELDHNEIAGWKQLSDVTSERFVLIMLRDPEDHDRVALRFDITKRLVEDGLAEVVEIEAEGVSPLARVLSLVLITQLASIYLGLSYDVDPAPVEVIQKLKAELAEK
jgi:glucose/mannose-6-phosphate isomerase